MNKMPAQTVNNIYLSKEMYIKLEGERYTREQESIVSCSIQSFSFNWPTAYHVTYK